ncbi:helix-turn-helix domain-containing protein [Devosia sp. MC532]|uniref:helix-turn-helix transcriptional regulator n=1 Tax=Devosia sp. MC532 TaxID=2799788 RepID=UPI0018F3F5AB|nr:helix-turn-helix domain-containing protein [Devosia sp. MC532]MBJ7579370.1 helix-turn-helix domain-containing protein [Devosia sp. MC532]
MNDYNALLDAKAAANLLALSPSTLAKLRIYGGGPRYLKLGRRVAYAREDLDAWLDQNRRASTSDLTK